MIEEDPIDIDDRPIEILLVEDNPGDVRLTREAFKGASVPNNLHVVTDGAQAIAFLRRTGDFGAAARPDLVLLDLNLPKKPGREVLEVVKSDPDLRTIPIVILTSSSAEEDIIGSYDRHANCFVTKPSGLDRFRDAVDVIEEFWFKIVRLPRRAPWPSSH